MPMVLGYIPRSEGYIPLFFQGTIVMGTVVPHCYITLRVVLVLEWFYLGRAQTASALQRAESVHSSKGGDYCTNEFV
jgi:hypothetical protein